MESSSGTNAPAMAELRVLNVLVMLVSTSADQPKVAMQAVWAVANLAVHAPLKRPLAGRPLPPLPPLNPIGGTIETTSVAPGKLPPLLKPLGGRAGAPHPTPARLAMLDSPSRSLPTAPSAVTEVTEVTEVAEVLSPLRELSNTKVQRFELSPAPPVESKKASRVSEPQAARVVD